MDDVLRAVPPDGGKAHLFEQRGQLVGVGTGIFDELKAVGAERVVKKVCHGGLPDAFPNW